MAGVTTRHEGEAEPGLLGKREVETDVERARGEPWSEALHRGCESRPLLPVQVPRTLQARVGCFILTDSISNNDLSPIIKISSGL